MPVTPTYPGVYIEEVPSSVRTIMGVATSIAAFVGKAKRGPVNKAERVLSFSEFVRKFGGLSASSQMSYAVQQFFLNGGNETWIVRIAKNPKSAGVKDDISIPLNGPAEKLLKVIAKFEGKTGNDIRIDVDYSKARNPASAFNLTVRYEPQDSPTEARTELFTDLTMGHSDPRYAVRIINQQSDLIQVEEILDPQKRKTALENEKGKYVSADLATEQDALRKLITKRSNRLQVQINGLPALDIALDPEKDSENLVKLCEAIQKAVRVAGADNALTDFTCEPVDGKRISMTSGVGGEASRVEVFPGILNDVMGALKLALGEGAMQTDAVAILRPPKGSKLLEGGDEDDFDETAEPGLYAPDTVGGKTPRTGIYALETVDLFNLLCLPGMKDPIILAKAAQYCEKRRAFLIADAPGGDETSPVTPDQMERIITGTSYPKTKNGAVYYPWLRIGDTLRPPSGTIAGLMAQIDTTRGLWKAPAGIEATLKNVQGLEYTLTDDENGILNPRGVNCLRVFPVYGAVAWGARTLLGDDAQASEWKYISIRRLALYIEESLYRGTKWVVFEPNDEPLWAQIRLNVGVFMHTLFRQGAFRGSTPQQAYFVKCDKETNPQADIDQGIVNILVGFAPLKPAEFVIIKLQQMAGDLQL